MALTRSATARINRIADINNKQPQAMQYFMDGVGSVLRQWTALELAIHHQWGGSSSTDKAIVLRRELIDLFLGPDKVYKDDIALILEDYLDTQFKTICEDGSPDDIGDILCTMWRQCLAGDFSLVMNTLAREALRSEMVSKSEGLVNGDAMDDDDDDDEGNDNEEEDIIARNATEASLQLGVLSVFKSTRDEAQVQLESIAEDDNEEMEVDSLQEPSVIARVEMQKNMEPNDEWAVVTRGKKTKQKKNTLTSG
jgi:pre-rRNA-processing protein TSR2